MKRLGILAASLIMAAATSGTAAASDDQPDGVVNTAPAEQTADEPAQAQSVTLSLTKKSTGAGLAAATIACTVTIDDPHNSVGAGGVIAKLRYSCYGTQSATLGINGSIYRYAPGVVGPYAPKATHNGSRAVYPGAVDTFYIPAQSQPGIACYMSHWYFAGAYLTLTSGPSAATGSVYSNTVHPNSC